jgi:vitamin K-dependent gamma-carboxylase
MFSRRARPFILVALTSFHFMNDRLFRIGIFPWFAIVATTLFLPPEWPRLLWAEVRRRPVLMFLAAATYMAIGLFFHRSFELVPALVGGLAGMLIVWSAIEALRDITVAPRAEPEAATPVPAHRPWLVAFLAAWCTVQFLMPLRHFAIPGDVGWTEEGHRFSWRMKLRNKSGYTTFYAYNPKTGAMLSIKPDTILAPFQRWEYQGYPHMIQPFAQYLSDRLKAAGKEGYEIRAISFVSLNFAPPRLMIPWGPDLASVRYSDFSRNSWVTRYDE